MAVGPLGTERRKAAAVSTWAGSVRLTRGPAAVMSRQQMPRSVHQDLIQGGAHVDELTDRRRIHRVVIAGHPHVVIPTQPLVRHGVDHRWDRWERQHLGLIAIEEIDRTPVEGPHPTTVGDRKPLPKLTIEVLR
jgi:hypothetical protein